MKKISWWAKQNRGKSRFGIAILYILIPVLGFATGRNLLMLGFDVRKWLLLLTLLFFFVGVLKYPRKKQTKKYWFSGSLYSQQKTCDWLLAFSSFLGVCFITNSPHSFISSNNSVLGATSPLKTVPVATRADDGKKSGLDKKTSRAERKALLKELKKLLKETFRGPRQKDLNSGTRITLVVLCIIGGAALSLILAALACNLACSGAETLAVLVIIFGAGAIATLLVLAIRHIFKKYPKVLVPTDRRPNQYEI